MSYLIEIIRKAEQNTTVWTGGTTTQLAIFPKDALYSERNFLWRMSSAKVEVEESVFTSLPGIRRLIMVLEGELQLDHEGHHKIALAPFEQDRFRGDWTTKSRGKVTDFNLMMADGWEGSLEAITLPKGAARRFALPDSISPAAVTEAIYCVKGKIDIRVDERTETLESGDFFSLLSEKKTSVALAIINSNENETQVVHARVFHEE
ncbi:HutD family protein [Geosporobacter ferrireducens]|uniref:HutD-family protein n=1 Tax=Geosporobacter ferrireducens TaxID=1424294 RepID=A0A1D8GEL4_9FIRM|nr:HutD family protein [Geosporobacter ferrireducens]AOT69351.1 hypothetical protein Gferi_07050 [Geosporobacter ferrireducens]